MTPIYLEDGKILTQDGKVGVGQGCCCGTQCNCSSPGTEPAVASNAERGLVWLTFSSCLGSGASATIDAPAAAAMCDYEASAGAIQAVTLTNAGSGYAKFGRVQPTVSVSVGGGTGATLSVSLQEGSGFLESCGLAFSLVPFWSVASVSATSGGSGYADGTPATFAVTSGTQVSAATGLARVAYDEPKNAVLDIFTSGGSGAVLEPVWQLTDTPPWINENIKVYKLAGVNVLNGGTGYADYDPIFISFPSTADGSVIEIAYIATDLVGAGGVIQQVYVADVSDIFTPAPGGLYRGSPTDALHSVEITNGGNYYKEDATVPPYVPAVTVTVNQESPSSGSGAVITATVNVDTSSPDFGKIKSVQVASGGSGYLNPPAACEFPDKLYVTFGDTTVEVPATTDSFARWFTLPGSPVGTVPDGLGASFPLSGPQDYSPEAMVGICTAGDCCVNLDAVVIPVPDLLNMTPPYQQVEDAFRAFVWKSFSLSFGLVIRPSQYSTAGDYGPLGAKILACQCDDQVHISLALVSYCYQYRPTGPSTVFNNGGFFNQYGLSVEVLRRKVFLYCLRFDKDENGCPVGDATIINTTVMDSGPPDCAPAEDWYGNLVTDCTCNTECFDGIEPVVSLMPP